MSDQRELEELRAEVRSLQPLKEFEVFAIALSVAREKHPEGTTVMDLAGELSELVRALFNSEGEQRVRVVALDIGICAFRIAIGGDRRQP